MRISSLLYCSLIILLGLLFVGCPPQESSKPIFNLKGEKGALPYEVIIVQDVSSSNTKKAKMWITSTSSTPERVVSTMRKAIRLFYEDDRDLDGLELWFFSGHPEKADLELDRRFVAKCVWAPQGEWDKIDNLASNPSLAKQYLIKGEISGRMFPSIMYIIESAVPTPDEDRIYVAYERAYNSSAASENWEEECRRKVAEKFGITPEEVFKIHRRVASWLRSIPNIPFELDPSQTEVRFIK